MHNKSALTFYATQRIVVSIKTRAGVDLMCFISNKSTPARVLNRFKNELFYIQSKCCLSREIQGKSFV